MTIFNGLAEKDIYVQVLLFLDGKQVAKGERSRSWISEHVRDNPRK
ncbi:hypothetical protein [Flavobacterium selenitireducens]|nr:hypothetical protein [Flavobacterium selenitireducens]MBD3582656.1 hypothetical protein [Flavobacterium selenitireducens]